MTQALGLADKDFKTAIIKKIHKYIEKDVNNW